MTNSTNANGKDSDLPVLAEGTIIVPYRKGWPMILYENMDSSNPDCFIRARLHPTKRVWYADVDEAKPERAASMPRDPHHHRSQGVVVFLSVQQLTYNVGIRVTRMFNSGKSARGTVIELPGDWQDLYTHDTGALFKPI